jgi:hypothetical protein
MATNQSYIPDLNPVRLVPVGTPELPSFRNDWFVNQIKPYEQRTNYYQKWVAGSIMYLQFTSNFSPVQIDIIDCRGNLIQTHIPQAITTSYFNPTQTVYQSDFQVPSVFGLWYLKLSIGFDETTTLFISEPQLTVANINNLMKIEYWHDTNDQDVYFMSGLKYTMFVEAIRGPLAPKTRRSVWEDQPLNLKTIRSIPYQQFKFILGDAYGVPEYIGDKMARIFSCDNVFLNGVQYTQEEGSVWEVNQVDLYPMFGYRTDIRPTKNIIGLQSENNNSIAENFAVVYNIETKAFGTFNGNASSNIIQVTEVQ